MPNKIYISVSSSMRIFVYYCAPNAFVFQKKKKKKKKRYAYTIEYFV